MSLLATPNERYDAVIVGGGVGGLVAACYLARSGARVAVLEARPVLGGTAETAEIAEGFRAPFAAHVFYALDARSVRDLKLEEHGLQFAQRDMTRIALRPGGRHLSASNNACWSEGEDLPFSPVEGKAYARFQRELLAFARRLRPWWTPGAQMPPGGHDSASIAAVAHRLALSARDADILEGFSRLSAAAYLDRWLEDDALKAALSFDVAIDGMSPQEPGSALLLLWRQAQEIGGKQAAVCQVLGGPSGLVDALERAARAAGVEIRTHALAVSLTVENGRVAGAVLAGGETIRAGVVLSCLDARRTLLELTPPAAIGFGTAANLPPPRDVAPAKLLLALNAAPPFAGLQPGDLRARFVLAERPESAAEAKGAALDGCLPGELVMELTVPTAADPELAPAGCHVLSAVFPDMPVSLAGGWDGACETFRARAVAALEAYAPGLRDRIVAQRVLTPDDMALRYGGGSASVPPLTRLLMSYEARIRTDLPGLYLCGHAAEPAGAISGRAGRFAAQLALAELRRREAGGR